MQFEQFLLSVLQGAQTFVNTLSGGGSGAVQPTPYDRPTVNVADVQSTFVRMNGWHTCSITCDHARFRCSSAPSAHRTFPTGI
jgi:hypothetical protein